MERWVKKIAVVTGASSGIGKAISKSLTIAGMNVIGLARRVDRLEELSKELEGSSGTFEYIKCDMREEQDILNSFEFVENKYGGIDVLVNNAGVALSSTISNGKTEDFRKLLDTNLLAPTICSREVIKSLRQRQVEGHIFFINSVFGLSVLSKNANVHVYPTSKFGLRAMADTLKEEIYKNKDNIKITSIHPGLVKTEIVRSSGHGDQIFDVLPHLQSEEIADCLVYALGTPPGTQIGQMVISALHEKL